MGLHTVYVTHDAAAIIGDRFGYHFLCKSPDWNVHCFRPAEKIEWIARLDGFSGRACFNPFGDPTPTGGPTVFMKHSNECGIPGSVYIAGPTPKCVVIGADKIVVAPQVADFLTRLYDIPNCGKVPIYRSFDNGRGRKYSSKKAFSPFDQGKDLRSGLQIEIKTLSAEKIPFNAKDFASPKGFKRIAQLTSVVYSPTQKETVKDTLDNMGFSSPLGRQKK